MVLFLLIINKKAGKGNAQSIANRAISEWQRKGILCEIFVTEHPYHAERRISELKDVPKYDAIVAISGDGILHEIYNGMLSRTDSAEALKVPVTQIPCGSANSMFSTIIKEFNCLTNAENWKQIQIDCLNWIPKLNKVKHDGILFKLSNGQSRHSFLNTEFGMMALVDKTSEVLRFLGDIRFPLGSMYHLASMKFHKATLYVLNTNDFVDAVQSAQDTISNAEELKNNVTSISSAELNSIIKEFSIELDPIRMDEAISWKCIKGPFLSVYASIKRMIMLNVETDRDLKLANNFISLNYQDDQTTRLHQLKLTRYLQNGVQLVNNISIKSIKSPAFVLLCPTESLFMIDGESYYLRCVYGELQKEIFTTLAPDTL